MGGQLTYPDSVNRVNPPNTTIPNTLPADARSQYATVFDEVSGKNAFLTFSFSALDIVWLSEVNGDVFLAAISGNAAALLLNRMLLERFALLGILICRAAGRACFIQ